MEKCLVIGLDGVAWKSIKLLIDEGFLPTLKKLMEEGVWGDLQSTMPPTTGAAWVSYATGRNPGKHGVFDFLKFKERTYDLEVVSSTDIKSKTYYEDLSENGYRSILINLPVSYPPKKINGIIVTSFLTQNTGQMVYPPEIISRYTDEFKSYILYSPETPMVDTLPYLDEVSRIERMRFALAKSLFLNEEWDHFFLLFSGTDWISHAAMGCLSDKHNGVKYAFVRQFQEIDSYIKWFLENLGNEVNLFLVSDHGQTQRRKMLFINEWLCQKGYSISKMGKDKGYKDLLKKEKPEDMSNTKEITLPKIIIKIVRRLPIQPILNRVIRILRNRLRVNLTIKPYAIDITSSKVFCNGASSSYAIYINDTSRFENGIVSREELIKTREHLILELNGLEDPSTGERLLEHVWRKEEVYQGPFVDRGPDILLLPVDGVSFQAGITRSYYIEEGGRGGCHNMNGIFLAYGPDIKQGQNISNAELYDVAPTILHTFGLPIPGDMDGRVLSDIFREGSEPAQRKIIYHDAEPEDDEKSRIKEKIKKLKALGKIGSDKPS